MLPRYEAELDNLFQEQEMQKQQTFQKDFQNLQMKYGGDLTQFGIGGDIAAGLVGAVGGAVGTIPGIGAAAQKGLYGIHEAIDGDLTEQEKSIRGFGQAAGGIATGAFTGNVGGAIKQGASGIGAGINAGTDGQYSDLVDPLAGAASMAGNFFAYGGKIAPPLFPKRYGDKDFLEWGKEQMGDGDWMSLQYRDRKEARQYKDEINKKIRDGYIREDGTDYSQFSKTRTKDFINKKDDSYTFAYGGRLPKMEEGGPTYQEWLTTRPDMRNDQGSAQVYNEWLANVYPTEGFDPNNIYQGNTGIQTDSKGNYTQSPGETYDVAYNQSHSQIGPGRDKTIPTEFQKQYGANDQIYTAPSTKSYYEESVTEDPTQGSPGNKSNTVQDLLYKGAAYSPTIYNAIRGMQKPQVLDQEEFQNPYERQAMGLMSNRQYNIDPQLQSNRSTFNSSRIGLKNYAGGNAATYLSNIGNLQMNTDRMNEAAYAQKQNMDNQYRAQEAGFMGQMGQQRASTKLGIQDINDRNKAARDAHLGKAFEGLSGIAQNNRRMSNLEGRDGERMVALNNLFPDYEYGTDENGRVTGFKYKG